MKEVRVKIIKKVGSWELEVGPDSYRAMSLS
jgi:hypothetical protein